MLAAQEYELAVAPFLPSEPDVKSLAHTFQLNHESCRDFLDGSQTQTILSRSYASPTVSPLAF